MTYWQQRVIDADVRKEQAIAKALPELLSHMQDARRSLEKEVNAFYTRYATNNKITLAEAQRVLSLSELADFKGDLKAFKKLAKQSIGTFNLQLENLSVKTRVTRLEALLAQCDAVLQNCYQQQKAAIEGAAGTLAQEQYLHALYDIEQYTGFQFPFSQLSNARISKMLQMPVQGVDISSSLWRQDFDTGYQIRRVLNNMFTTGRPPQDFAKELQRIIGRRDAEGNLIGKTYEAYRLLYNEASHVSEQAKLAAYEDDDIEELSIDTTLDSKTCSDCSPRDGKVIKVKDAVEGETVPPYHVYCRCTTVPHIPEAQGAFTSTRAARDPETGKTVRVKAESYEDWRVGLEKRIGADKLTAAEKMSRKESSDFRQYEKYKEILSKDAPKSFASFQDLKYNDIEKWVEVKASKQDILNSKDFKDIQGLKGKLGDKETRIWYDAHDKRIPNLIDRTRSIEEQARQAHELRNLYRTQARELMKNQELRKILDETRPNKSFEEMLAHKMQGKGLTREQALEDIVKTAATPNKEVNKKFGLED
ncbi:MAG: minor capsid protein [Candidatus Fimivivens sp.]|nr:minor capsid protein [Candidatus Fimivivens sp.]